MPRNPERTTIPDKRGFTCDGRSRHIPHEEDDGAILYIPLAQYNVPIRE
jgi:hypothetical protein